MQVEEEKEGHHHANHILVITRVDGDICLLMNFFSLLSSLGPVPWQQDGQISPLSHTSAEQSDVEWVSVSS